jgi:hypothetical protein
MVVPDLVPQGLGVHTWRRVVECVGLVGGFWEEGGVVVDRDYARVCGG